MLPAYGRNQSQALSCLGITIESTDGLGSIEAHALRHMFDNAGIDMLSGATYRSDEILGSDGIGFREVAEQFVVSTVVL